MERIKGETGKDRQIGRIKGSTETKCWKRQNDSKGTN